MTTVTSAGQVLEAVQRVKNAAPAFCTNFFASESRLRDWISHGELSIHEFDRTAFFLRKDRDFCHLFFSASDPQALGGSLIALPSLRSERLSADLIGQEAALPALLAEMNKAGFRAHSRLVRLSRAASNAQAPQSPDPRVEFAQESDAFAVLELLERNFDRFADQLPLEYEVRAAIGSRQILIARESSTIGALLHFETQGFSSTLRYWLVAPQVRSAGLGSLLIRHYFASQTGARRFMLWVAAANENAVQKYHHYGYAPDGLVDHVLVNSMVPS